MLGAEMDNSEELKILVDLATDSAAKLLTNKNDKEEYVKYQAYVTRLDELGYRLDLNIEE